MLQITSSKAFIYALHGGLAQLVAVLALAERLPANCLAFIDNTAGEAALRKGYGKDAFVNGMLATFWGTAARRGWRPQFAQSGIQSQRSVSREPLQGWTRLNEHTDAITESLTRAASDVDYATNQAVYDLEDAID